MNLTNDAILAAREKTLALMNESRQRVDRMFGGGPAEAILPIEEQRATFEKVKANPMLVQKIKAQHGEDGWQRYVESMTKLQGVQDESV